ncbi:MAG: hypothetical protein EOP50_10315 [Sphingobacteriales bacterium]|nr:MAG: hypothetical protein EOP50_10315 [Sphingobacteriales bacterium]
MFVAQITLGFMEGALFTPSSNTLLLLAGPATALLICSAIFASFATRTPEKPFVHAWLGLLLQCLFAALLSAAISLWLGSTPWLSVMLEWVVLVLALVVGTSLGVGLRYRKGGPADA